MNVLNKMGPYIITLNLINYVIPYMIIDARDVFSKYHNSLNISLRRNITFTVLETFRVNIVFHRLHFEYMNSTLAMYCWKFSSLCLNSHNMWVFFLYYRKTAENPHYSMFQHYQAYHSVGINTKISIIIQCTLFPLCILMLCFSINVDWFKSFWAWYTVLDISGIYFVGFFCCVFYCKRNY